MTIIIIICTLLLIAYLFDISSALTKIPSVILLLFLGWIARRGSDFTEINVPDLAFLLPVIGTIGLILIVMEGALELELNKSKYPVIKIALLNALIPMFVLSFIFAFAFQYYEDVSYKIALINSIPFCVISSAIAIPSVRHLSSMNKEFVIYESSLSDIFGVLLFNFIALNEIINLYAFWTFFEELVLFSLLSLIAVTGLSFILGRIKHHITYTPIILCVILIYAVAKVYHLPALIFILVFGLVLGNLDELKRFKWFELFRPDKLNNEVVKFKEITGEATFLVRSLFFILFGYLMKADEILNRETLPWAIGIVSTIILVRLITLKISKLSVSPLLFVAPRGLINILLLISVLPSQHISLVNNSLILQTIILSVFFMMIGLMKSDRIDSNTGISKENE